MRSNWIRSGGHDEENEQVETSPSVMDAVYEAMASFSSRKWVPISVLSAFVQCKLQVGEERVSQAIEAWLIVRVFLRKMEKSSLGLRSGLGISLLRKGVGGPQRGCATPGASAQPVWCTPPARAAAEAPLKSQSWVCTHTQRHSITADPLLDSVYS